MKPKATDNLFQASNALKVLAFLVDRPGRENLPGEIVRATGLSRVGVYLALRQLVKQKLISKQQRSRFLVYTVMQDNPVIKQYKILKSIMQLMPKLEQLKVYVKKIVLFGSVSRGEDYTDSDVDLFLLAKDPGDILDLVSKIKVKRKIQAIVKTPSEYADFLEQNPTFEKEIERGIVLWEEKA